MKAKNVVIVQVWCLQWPSGRLTGEPYGLGPRDQLMPEWWPTKREAVNQAEEGQKAVKVEVSWSVIS